MAGQPLCVRVFALPSAALASFTGTRGQRLHEPKGTLPGGGIAATRFDRDPHDLAVDRLANHFGFADASGPCHALDTRLLPIFEIDLLANHGNRLYITLYITSVGELWSPGTGC